MTNIETKKRILAILMAVLLVVLSSCSSSGNAVTRAYDQAMDDMKQGKYAEAAEKLAGISFYEDSVQLAQYCKAHALAEEGQFDEALRIFTSLDSYRDTEMCVPYFAARQAEVSAAGPASRVWAAYLYDQIRIAGFRDASVRAASIRSELYQEGTKAEESEDWAAANAAFSALEDYQDSATRSLYAQGRGYETGEPGLDTAQAAVCFSKIPGYSDSDDRKKQCLTAALEVADQLIANEAFDEAESIYSTLGGLCGDSKFAELNSAREKAKEAARQKKIAQADALVEEGKYIEAREIYLECEELQMADEALYQKAGNLASNGKTEEAAAEYLRLTGYKDSREQHYQLGTSLIYSDPETASRILLEDRDYPGVEDNLYTIAAQASEDANYSLSIPIFSELIGKKDSTLRMKNDLYLYGRKLLEQGEAGEAASVFDQVSGIGSADLYGNMARYTAAEELQKKGEYDAAASAFDLISGYSDAKDRAAQCRYTFALENKEKGKYKEAMELFAALGSLNDSGEQEKECRYLLAKSYEEKKQWEQAIELYEALRDYSDCDIRRAECYSLLGAQQLEQDEPENAYASFAAAGDSEGEAEAAFAVAESKTSVMALEEALKWYRLAAERPETEERTATIAQNLLNMEEDNLSEQYASVVPDSEKAKAVLYALALRSLERKDEEAAMRQMKKAGDNADASERFKAMFNDRVEALVAQEKYDDAIFLCSTWGVQEQESEIHSLKAQKEEKEKQKALEAERAEHETKKKEAQELLGEAKYEEAAKLYTEIGETELAAKAIEKQEAAYAEEEAARLKAEEAARAEEEAARQKAEEAERERIQALEEEAAGHLASGNFDEAINVYRQLDNQEKIDEAIYQKAEALNQPDLYLTIPDYKDSREQHYLAGKALLDSDPEKAFRILSDDISYSDASTLLYNLADAESKKENWQLSSAIFARLGSLPLDPENMKPDCLMRYVQDLYQYGMQLKEKGEWDTAAVIFDQLADIGNAKAHSLESYYAVASALENDVKYSQAAVAFDALGTFSDSKDRANKNRYQSALKLLDSGSYDAAEKAFAELGEFSNASAMVKECKYRAANDLLDSGKYQEAREAFELLGDYSSSAEKKDECIFQLASGYQSQGKYTDAIKLYDQIIGYGDASERWIACHQAVGDEKIAEAETFLRNGESEKAALAYQNAYAEYSQTGRQDMMDSLAMRTAECWQSVNKLGSAVEWFRTARRHSDAVSKLEEIVRFCETTEMNESAEYVRQNIFWVQAENALDAGEYRTAIDQYQQITDESLSKERVTEAYFGYGEQLMTEAKYAEAADAFRDAGSYNNAVQRVEDAIFEEAKALLAAGEYRDSYDLFLTIQNRTDVKNIINQTEQFAPFMYSVGKKVLFGHYGEDNSPIEWIVLNNKDGKCLLLSDVNLGSKPYNEAKADTTWEKCSLRNWLNNDFINSAFTPEERSFIQLTQIDNSSDQCYSGYVSIGGNTTNDYVFLLSYYEAFKLYFTSYASRANTNIGMWWLRSPGDRQSGAIGVNATGRSLSISVEYSCAIRPAIWVDLTSIVLDQK